MHTRIVFIGDKYQAPPPDRDNTEDEFKISPIFDIESIELVEKIRQRSTNSIIKLLDALIYDIDNNKDTFIKLLRDKPSDVNKKTKEGYVTININTFIKLAKQKFNYDNIFNNHNDARIITYTNSWVEKWNVMVRKTLGYDTLLNVEDFLVSYNTTLDTFGKPVIINSDDYFIKSINTIRTKDGFSVYKTEIYDPYTKKFRKINILNQDEDITKYKGILLHKFLDAKYANKYSRPTKWRAFYDFKDNYVNLIPIVLTYTERDVQRYQYINKSMYYGYAVTTHKIQGSSLKDVFIDYYDMLYYRANPNLKRRNVELSRRLLYTAISRATNIVAIIK
jgi:hypothetical protein